MTIEFAPKSSGTGAATEPVDKSAGRATDKTKPKQSFVQVLNGAADADVQDKNQEALLGVGGSLLTKDEGAGVDILQQPSAQDVLDTVVQWGGDASAMLLLSQQQLGGVTLPSEATPAAVGGMNLMPVRQVHGAGGLQANPMSEASAQPKGLAAKLTKFSLTASGQDESGSGEQATQPKLGTVALHEDGRNVVVERANKTIEALVSAMTRPSIELATAILEKGAERVQGARIDAKTLDATAYAPLQQGAGGVMGHDGVVANAAVPEAGQFSEQVGYWLGGDVQKAEISLDGFGLQPLEVSISMHGNEAHIAFRSDEVQTRDALANASEELKETLSRQGVLVSGVSVDTSGAGNASQQGGGGKQSGWKRATVEAALSELPVLTNRPVATKNSVDLFV